VATICVNLPRGRRWGPRTGRERRALRERTCQRWHRSTNTHTYPHDCVLHTLQPPHHRGPTLGGMHIFTDKSLLHTFASDESMQAPVRKGTSEYQQAGCADVADSKTAAQQREGLGSSPLLSSPVPSKGGMCFQLLSELRDESVASFVHKQAHQSMQHRRRIQQRRRLTCKLTKKSKHFSSLEIELCSVCQFTNGFSSPGQKGPPKSRPRPVTFDGPCRGRQRERGRARIGSACPTTTQPVLPNRIVDIPVTLLGAWLVLV
jgi:hypothetical protein